MMSKPSRRRLAAPVPPGRPAWPWLLALTALVLIVYGRAVGYGFLSWDDILHVTGNPGLRPVSWQSWRAYWEAPYQGLYIPVTYTTYALEAWLCQGPWSSAPGGRQVSAALFHGVNIALHLVNAWTVFALARYLTGRLAAAFFAAALFAVHPLMVETVVWVSERKGVLCGTFSMLAAWLYFRARGAPAEVVGDTFSPAHRKALLVAASVTFVLAMLAKPLAAAWPVSIAALEWAFYGRCRRDGLAVLAGWLVVAGLLTTVTQSAQKSEFVTPVVDRLPVAAQAVAHYGEKLLVPVRLVADYGFRPEWLTRQPWFGWLWLLVIGGLALAIVAVGAWWRRPQLVGLRIALGTTAAFLLAIAPVSGLIPFAFQDISTVADRYVYLAMLAPALGLAWLVARYEAPPVVAAAGLGVLALSVLSWMQVGIWRNDEAIWKHTLEVHEQSYLAMRGLGAIYAAEGEIDRALPLMYESYRLKSNHNLANNLAWIYATYPEARLRNGPRALEIAQAIATPPYDSDPSFLDTLAAAQAECGQFAEAAATAQRAVELARSGGFTALADEIAARAALYRAGKPYRSERTFALPGTE